MPQCLMCGSNTALTREHAIPAWVGRELDPLGAPVMHRYQAPYSGVQREWTAAGVDVKVRKVCQACNSGWMAELEAKAQTVLGPLIRGESRVLTTVDCKLTTQWFLKTMLFLELAGDPEQRVAFLKHEQWVRTGQVPPALALWIGSARQLSGIATAGRGMEVRVGNRVGAGWLFAMVLGRLILVAFGAPNSFGASQLTAPMSRALARLWPMPPLTVPFPGRVQLGRKQVPLIIDLVHQSLPSSRP
ncbi:MAG: hypothetical protein M3443_13845 [Actinomycetota bacterium]|nr:hypothetical protein [Actinomycetota bacterium]